MSRSQHQVFFPIFVTFGVLPSLILWTLRLFTSSGRTSPDSIGAAILTSVLFLVLGLYLAFDEVQEVRED